MFQVLSCISAKMEGKKFLLRNNGALQ